MQTKPSRIKRGGFAVICPYSVSKSLQTSRYGLVMRSFMETALLLAFGAIEQTKRQKKA